MKQKYSLSSLLELSVPERILTVQYLWDSISEIPKAVALTQEQKDELDRRLESFIKHPDEVVSWREIKSKLLKSA